MPVFRRETELEQNHIVPALGRYSVIRGSTKQLLFTSLHLDGLDISIRSLWVVFTRTCRVECKLLASPLLFPVCRMAGA